MENIVGLLGDDDTIGPEGINLVLSALDNNPELSGISVNRKIYDNNLEIEIDKQPLQPHLIHTRLYKDAAACLS